MLSFDKKTMLTPGGEGVKGQLRVDVDRQGSLIIEFTITSTIDNCT